MISVLMRSLMANRDDFMRHATPDDAVLVPPIPAGMGFLEWRLHRDAMDAAYLWARDEVRRIASEGHAAASLPHHLA